MFSLLKAGTAVAAIGAATAPVGQTADTDSSARSPQGVSAAADPVTNHFPSAELDGAWPTASEAVFALVSAPQDFTAPDSWRGERQQDEKFAELLELFQVQTPQQLAAQIPDIIRLAEGISPEYLAAHQVELQDGKARVEEFYRQGLQVTEGAPVIPFFDRTATLAAVSGFTPQQRASQLDADMEHAKDLLSSWTSDERMLIGLLYNHDRYGVEQGLEQGPEQRAPLVVEYALFGHSVENVDQFIGAVYGNKVQRAAVDWSEAAQAIQNGETERTVLKDGFNATHSALGAWAELRSLGVDVLTADWIIASASAARLAALELEDCDCPHERNEMRTDMRADPMRTFRRSAQDLSNISELGGLEVQVPYRPTNESIKLEVFLKRVRQNAHPRLQVSPRDYWV